MKKSVRIVDLA
jgi:ATP-dependent RNA helicase DDX21